MKCIRQINLILYKMISILVLFFGICLVFTMFWQVISRYLLYIPSPWTIELSQYLFAWFALLGAAKTFRDKEHFKVEIIFNIIPKKIRKLLDILFSIILSAVFVILAFYGTNLSFSMAYRYSPILNISRFWLYVSVPISALIMFIFQLSDILDHRNLSTTKNYFNEDDINE